MVRIRPRSDSNNLYFDFSYQGHRCREQTMLKDTKENRIKLNVIAKKIDTSITLNQFNYADYFPNSKMVQKFSDRAARVDQLTIAAEAPTVEEFMEVWFEEMKPTWRASYINGITSIFNGHVLPTFAKQGVSRITKADLLQFRANLAKASLETGKTRSATTVNKKLGSGLSFCRKYKDPSFPSNTIVS